MSPDLDGRHEVSIGEGCAFTGIVIHELMHAIGKKICIVSIGIVIVTGCISNACLFNYR